MDISFENIPRCLVQNWVLSNLSYYGVYDMIADRVSRIYGSQVTKRSVVNSLTVILKEQPSVETDNILKESVSLIKEQGISVPDFVNMYFG